MAPYQAKTAGPFWARFDTSIYGLEDSGDAPCLVLELVEGQTLAEALASGSVAPDSALDIARQVALGLEAAHEKDIVHRDLKPANVKVTPEGTVKVLDFGLAKALAGERVFFSANRSGDWDLYTKSASGTLPATRLLEKPHGQHIGGVATEISGHGWSHGRRSGHLDGNRFTGREYESKA